MGDKTLEPSTSGPQKEEYKIVAYQGPALPQEFVNLIRAPFLNSLRYGNDLFKLTDKESYYGIYGRYIDALLQRPKAIVRMAVLSDGTVAGWALVEMYTLHYVWVKKEVRRKGIAASLIPKDLTTISHVTNIWLNMWNKKYYYLIFNPFA
jgi:hypothetical protein